MAKNVNEIPIIEQVMLSLNGNLNVMAFLLGSIITGSVPVGTYFIAHEEVVGNPWMWIGVFFGAVFSLVTVYRWGLVMFKSQVRAVGYCALVEFGMIFSTIEWLAILLLSIVVFINGVSGGCALVLDWLDSEEKKQQEQNERFSTVDSAVPLTGEQVMEKQRLRRGAIPTT